MPQELGTTEAGTWGGPALAADDPLGDIVIYDAEGRTFPLERLRGRFSVLVFGCPTCPPFLETVPALEAVYQDFSKKGVQFHLVFGGLMHPEKDTYLTPYSLADRQAVVATARERIGTSIPWLLDTPSQDLKYRIATLIVGREVREQGVGLPNCELILDPEGRVVAIGDWSDPAELRKELDRLVGPVDPPTIPAPNGPTIDSVAVLRAGEFAGDMADLPKHSFPVKALPSGDGPYYAKLQVRAGDEYLEKGRGPICFALLLDPVHHVQWNSLMPPRVEIDTDGAENVRVDAESLEYAPVTGEAILTREVGADVDFRKARDPVTVRVRYAVCDGDGRWCRDLTQTYQVTF